MKTAEEVLDRLQEIYDNEEAAAVTVTEANGRLQRLEAIRSYAESIREECARVVDECHYAPNDLASAIRSIELP